MNEVVEGTLEVWIEAERTENTPQFIINDANLV